MNKTQLAKSLDISRTQLYKLEARGMPTDKGLEAAKVWRNNWLNMDITQSKDYRIDGNKGVNHELTQVNYSDEHEVLNNVGIKLEMNIERDVLTNVIPELWFEQAGWLGAALRDQGVKITAEQLLEVQSRLYLIYMDEVIEYLEEKDNVKFYIGPVLNAELGDETYPSLIKRLNQILDAEPTH